MCTAVDSSVLWSIFRGENDARAWVDLLVAVRRESSLTVCDVVFAEVSPLFATVADGLTALESLGIEFDALTPESAFAAGEIFRKYRREGGPRRHLIPDFLIAAHALHQAGRLAARDRGYLRRYFPELPVLTPEFSQFEGA